MVSFDFESEELELPYYCEFEEYGYLFDIKKVNCKIPTTTRIEVS